MQEAGVMSAEQLIHDCASENVNKPFIVSKKNSSRLRKNIFR
jgi:hypothetical protein